MLIIILLIFTCILLFNNFENFTIFNPVNENTPKNYYNFDNYFNILLPSNNNTTSIYENRINLIPSTINKSMPNNNFNKIKSNKCCLVKKKLENNNFKYEYNKYNDLDCDIDNFVLDHNNQLLFDGINNWNNDECNNNNNTLGSCKHYNFECIDFIDEKTCYEYNNKMPLDSLHRKNDFTWSNKPCYNRDFS